jgi:Uri superfamily endonuclease
VNFYAGPPPAGGEQSVSVPLLDTLNQRYYNASMLESLIQSIPNQAGTYMLWLHKPRASNLNIGRLGRFRFPAGEYFYLGSACGPGGLRARLGRHLRGNGQPHWHIDRLNAAARVKGFGYRLRPEVIDNGHHPHPTECTWSQMLFARPDASSPAPGFGASDCQSDCTAHLVCFPAGFQHISAMIADQTGVPLRII